ncbi:hypothetical protein JXQ70_20100 [bacterium]|nr:hypothetical protein [bacterium]
MSHKNHNISLFMVFFYICLVVSALGLIIGCTDTDDDDDITQPTATFTPTSEVETPTPTETPEGTPTATPTPDEDMGILNIWTSPVAGDIYVNLDWVGYGQWQGELEVGIYLVTFGYVAGYETPDPVTTWVIEGETTHVEGIYIESECEPCSFENIFVDGYPYDVGDLVYMFPEQTAEVQFEFLNGVSWTASAEYGYIDITSGTAGVNTIHFTNYQYGYDVVTLEGTGFGTGADCVYYILFYTTQPTQ